MAENGAYTDGAIQEAPNNWLKNLFHLRRVKADSASQYLSQSAFYKAGRWMLPEAQEGFLSFSESVCPPDDDIDSQIQCRFMDIFNDVLHYFGFGESRKILATQSTDDEWNDSHFKYDKGYSPPPFSTRPDLVLLGHDPKSLPRAVETYTREMSASVEERRDLYRGCVAIGKVQRSRRWNAVDMMLEKVATCARECFLHQPARRFVYCFSLNPELFQLFFFDRNGVVRSESLDIHKDAIQLVQAIQVLASANLENMGFDPAIYWENGVQCVDVVNRVDGIPVTSKYEIDRVISQKMAISGCATLCWSLRQPEGGKLFVMKDMWRKNEDGREEEFLAAITQAGISGANTLHLIDQTYASRPLSIASIRRGQGLTSGVSDNRTFSRLIFEYAGPSICNFQSGLQLLQALRAAIDTHRRLVKAGFLHRNICPSHILVGNQKVGHPSGVLIDFSTATRCENGKTKTDNDDLVGNILYRSVNNLDATFVNPDSRDDYIRKRHSFVDDLEAFLWVYLWIIMSQDGPGPQNARFDSCSFLRTWCLGEKGDLEALKGVHLIGGTEDFEFAVAPFFSHPAYSDLHHSFRHLCRTSERERRISARSEGGEKDFFPGMDALYDEVLSFFDDAIEQISKEFGPQTSTVAVPGASASIIIPPSNQTDAISSPPPSSTRAPAPAFTPVPAPLVTPTTARQPARRMQPNRGKRCRVEEESTDSRDNKRAKLAPLPVRPQCGLSSKSRIPNTKPKTVPTPIVTRRSERLRAMQAAVAVPPPAAHTQRKRKAPAEAGIRKTRARVGQN